MSRRWQKTPPCVENSQQGPKPLHSNEQTDDVKLAACGFSQDVLRSITLIQMALLAFLLLTTVLCSALLAISKRQEMMLDELLKRSGERQDTSVLINPETRSQVGSYRDGKGK
jgi:hypothetical protein